MSSKHVVVDGSNIATEGRSMPSLAQLDQAVREFMLENPDDVVTVVVDASFGHRINASEVDMYEEAEAAGELVSPPAGAIGRGDAFLLRIADKTGATVLSNDSFQEFHGEHEWLFDKGRLVGGKPVPGVGWIFTPRTPVRGPKSREAVKEAKRTRKGSDAETASAIPGLDLAAERARGKGKGKKTVERAIAVATEEAVEPKVAKRRRRRSKGGVPPAEPVNEPLAFITFIAAHPLGTEVEGTVDSFASHGAFVTVEGARCYLPLSAMGDPPPRSGREIFARGDTRRFVIQALDPQRRGVELALPGFVRVAGWPTDETVEAEIAGAAEEPPAPVETARKRGSRRGQATAAAEAGPATPVAASPAKRRRKAADAAPTQGEGAAVVTEGEPAAAAVAVSAEGEPAAAAAPARRAPARTKKAAAKAPSVERRQPARPQEETKKATTAEPAKRARSTRSGTPDAPPALTSGPTLPVAKVGGGPAAGQPQAAQDEAHAGAGAGAVAGDGPRSARAAKPSRTAGKKGAGAGAGGPAGVAGGANKGAATVPKPVRPQARAAKSENTSDREESSQPVKGAGAAKATKSAQPVRVAAAPKAPTDSAAPAAKPAQTAAKPAQTAAKPAQTAAKPAKTAKAAKAVTPSQPAKTAQAVKATKAIKTTKALPTERSFEAPPATAARAVQATKSGPTPAKATSPAPAAKAVKAAKKARPAGGSAAAGPSGSGQPPAP